jgi:tetrahydromethanopterin S-methyltransferase subunit G
MPLTPKDDVDESRVASDQSDDEALGELRERVDDLDERTKIPMGLDTLDELAAGQEAMHNNLKARVDELESRVDRQVAVLYDLLDAVEVLGAAVDPNDFETARITVANEDSDAYPWKWDTETLGFKAEEFE